jgi:hypothetical protein
MGRYTRAQKGGREKHTSKSSLLLLLPRRFVLRCSSVIIIERLQFWKVSKQDERVDDNILDAFELFANGSTG